MKALDHSSPLPLIHLLPEFLHFPCLIKLIPQIPATPTNSDLLDDPPPGRCQRHSLTHLIFDRRYHRRRSFHYRRCPRHCRH